MFRKPVVLFFILSLFFASHLLGFAKRGSSDETTAPATPAPQHVTGVVDDMVLDASFDFGTSAYGLPVPAFIDQNNNQVQAYKIGSFDLMVDGGLEKIMGSFKVQETPIDWGVKGKATLAYTYWQTQQGGGEPGNYFADNGFPNSQTGLHSGDEINISGFWWALSPELTAHMTMNEYIKFGASLGVSLFGYMGMSISDPWSGYSTSISDTTNVWHSDFLQKNLPGLALGIDFSLSATLTPPESDYRVFLETGITGPSWNLGLGYEYPFSQLPAKAETTEKAPVDEKKSGVEPEKENGSGNKPASAPVNLFSLDNLNLNVGAGYQNVLMESLNNSMSAADKAMKSNPSYSNVSDTQLGSAISIMAALDMTIQPFFFGPESGYLYCFESTRDITTTQGSTRDGHLSAGLIPLEIQGGYELKPGAIKGFGFPYVIDATLAAGVGFGSAGRVLNVTNDALLGTYQSIANYYGQSGMFDINLGVRTDNSLVKGWKYGANIGYRYCIIDKLTTDKNYTTTYSDNTTSTVKKGSVYGSPMDYRGVMLTAFAGYDF